MKKKKIFLFKVEQNYIYTLASTLLHRLDTQYVQQNIQYVQTNIKYISINDHRFDIRHWAQNPQLHVGSFHNFTRFLNEFYTLHSLISLSSVVHKTGDKINMIHFSFHNVLYVINLGCNT